MVAVATDRVRESGLQSPPAQRMYTPPGLREPLPAVSVTARSYGTSAPPCTTAPAITHKVPTG
jgi:hypothetical protein